MARNFVIFYRELVIIGYFLPLPDKAFCVDADRLLFCLPNNSCKTVGIARMVYEPRDVSFVGCIDHLKLTIQADKLWVYRIIIHSE